MTQTLVRARVTGPGFHAWPSAPEEVAFLRARHRHLFTFEVECRPAHGDRAAEFFLLQHASADVLHRTWPNEGHGWEFGAASCEQLSAVVARQLVEEGWPVSRVVAWEDGENGGGVEL